MNILLKHYFRVTDWLNHLTPLLQLALRGYVAWAFFKSGLTKIQTWDSTLYLFQEEYRVPLLPPELAAYLATSAELVLPVLLVFGLFGHIAAAGLFILNAVAVYSYYDQLGDAGILQHTFWGVLLLICLLQGMGRFSADHYLARRFA